MLWNRRIHGTCNCYPSWWNCRCYSYSSVTNPFLNFTSPCTPSIGCSFLDPSHHSGIYGPTGTKYRLINNRACISPLCFSVHMTTAWKRYRTGCRVWLVLAPRTPASERGEGRKIKIKHFLLLLSAAEFSLWNPLAQEIKGGISNNRWPWSFS